MSAPFRVLSLSGGGIRGVFSAAVLCELQASLRNHTGDNDARLTDYFDLIVGTSTGGLLALGLAFGKDPEELLQVYKEKGRHIFPRLWLNWRTAFGLFLPLFSQRRLRDVVEAMVPVNKTLGEAQCQLVLPAVRRDTGETTCLKTKHSDEFYKDHLMSAVEAGLATAAAPVAFGHVRTKRHGELLDGGLWANTPVLVGLVEARRYFHQDFNNVRVLSVGTTHGKVSRPRLWHWGGILEYGGMVRGRLQPLLWEGQRCLAIRSATLMLPTNALLHIDHEFAGRGYSMMNASRRAIRALEDAGRRCGQNTAARACALCFSDGEKMASVPLRQKPASVPD